MNVDKRQFACSTDHWQLEGPKVIENTFVYWNDKGRNNSALCTNGSATGENSANVRITGEKENSYID